MSPKPKSLILSNRNFLLIAISFSLSNITTPLLASVDTAVIGHLNDKIALAGVAVGSTIFTFLVWLTYFVRITTSAKSAAALGSGKQSDLVKSFLQPMTIALLLGTIVLIVQQQIWDSAIKIVNPDQQVAQAAYSYFSVIIWSLPISFLNYVTLGWLMGQAKAKLILIITFVSNLINLLADLLLVYYFNFGVAGVAGATVASYITFFICSGSAVIYYSGVNFKQDWRCGIFKLDELKEYIVNNGYLLIRSLSIVTVFTLMPHYSAFFGAEIIATNAIITQIAMLLIFLYDGMSDAGGVFAGKAKGAKDPQLLNRTIKTTLFCSSLLSLITTIVLALFMPWLVYIYTSLDIIIELYKQYSYWIVGLPLVSVYGLAMTGIYFGLQYPKPLAISTLISAVSFFTFINLTIDYLGNHSLWLAILIFYALRSSLLIFSNRYLKQHIMQ